MALLLAGCGASGGSGRPAGTPGEPTRPADGTRMPASPATPAAAPTPPGTPVTGDNQRTLPPVKAAIEDLARQRGVDPAKVEIERVEAVEWPDMALGCPEPGRVYAQVITPGYRVALRLDGQTVVYHTDRASQVVSC
jgi:hypothetical protein